MTLDKFLDATADIPAPALRSAMVLALAAEPARTPDAYPRFYDRVMEALGLPAAGSSEPAARLLSRAAS
jgi:hypothetical protein